MAQINVNRDTPPAYDPQPTYSDPDGSKAAVSNNLTWAIAVVLIIAALAVAIVYVAHNIHP